MIYRYGSIIILLPIVLAVTGAFLWYITAWSSAILLVSGVYIIILTMCGIICVFKSRFAFGLACFLPAIMVVVIHINNRPVQYIEDWGFRLKAERLKEYVASCNPKAFVESGTQQSIGLCEIINRGWASDPHYILYDTSGGMDLSPVRRTQEWKDSAKILPNGSAIARSSSNTRRIYGPFYDVEIPLEDVGEDSG
jgi:hypothetical protein